jgi:hypothetical protein
MIAPVPAHIDRYHALAVRPVREWAQVHPDYHRFEPPEGPMHDDRVVVVVVVIAVGLIDMGVGG